MCGCPAVSWQSHVSSLWRRSRSSAVASLSITRSQNDLPVYIEKHKKQVEAHGRHLYSVVSKLCAGWRAAAFSVWHYDAHSSVSASEFSCLALASSSSRMAWIGSDSSFSLASNFCSSSITFFHILWFSIR